MDHIEEEDPVITADIWLNVDGTTIVVLYFNKSFIVHGTELIWK